MCGELAVNPRCGWWKWLALRARAAEQFDRDAARLQQGMLENQDRTTRRLTQRDHDEIRYWRYCGLTIAEIAAKFDIGYNATRYRIAQYKLDAPVSAAEAVRLELAAAFRETNQRLAAPDITAADHARLCATQVRQADALIRAERTDPNTEDETMSRKSEAAQQRILAMSDEDALDELRRMAGLEHKSTGSCDTADARTGEPSVDESVSDTGDGSSETAAGADLADMVVHGRTGGGQDAGGS